MFQRKNGSPQVLIVGGGIGGLTAALALLRRGIDCAIYEQASELREIGAGLQLSPNGTRVLFDLGLEEQVREVGVQTRDKIVRLWSTGQTWSLFDPNAPSPTEKFGAPLFLMHRGDLHSMLVEAVRAEKKDAIHLKARCNTVSQTKSEVRLTLEGGREVCGDILIGADGVHSRVREVLFGPSNPKFTGIMAWRGLAPVDRLPKHLRSPTAMQWLGPKGHVTCYPVRRGKLLNMVGEVERDDWQKESWVERGTHAECAADFHEWNSDLLDILSNIEVLYKWALFLRDPLPQWSIGRISLLGDASHPMLPFLGQGANMAIEDGLILAQCINKHSHNLVLALNRYETARIARTTEIVRRSAAMASTFHHDALYDPVAGADYIGKHWNPKDVNTRYDNIYGYNASLVEV